MWKAVLCFGEHGLSSDSPPEAAKGLLGCLQLAQPQRVAVRGLARCGPADPREAGYGNSLQSHTLSHLPQPLPFLHRLRGNLGASD